MGHCPYITCGRRYTIFYYFTFGIGGRCNFFPILSPVVGTMKLYTPVAVIERGPPGSCSRICVSNRNRGSFKGEILWLPMIVFKMIRNKTLPGAEQHSR